jgi:predicted DNA-binding transcriptional regulator AlpA
MKCFSNQGNPPTNEILTAQEVAAELRCSKAHVYKLMNGQVKNRTVLPHIALGRKKVVRRSSFEAWKVLNENGAILLDDSEMKAVGAVI